MSSKSRLRRAEHYIRGGRCSECAAPSQGIVVAYDEAAQREALEERGPRCGRALTIIKVVYDDEEGGGDLRWL